MKRYRIKELHSKFYPEIRKGGPTFGNWVATGGSFDTYEEALNFLKLCELLRKHTDSDYKAEPIYHEVVL